jgi:hypothetical protein
MTVLEQLAEFVADAEGKLAQSKWLEDNKMRVYVRRGFHNLDGKPRICLDIANVTVFEEQQGTWTEFAAKAHEMNPWDCTFVECVHNEHLASWLLRSGFTPTEAMESFYLPKNMETWGDKNCNLPRARRAF